MTMVMIVTIMTTTWPTDADTVTDTKVGDATFRRPTYIEEDLYCRVGNCFWVFKNPWTCVKHRLTHFSVRWVCPGLCQLEESEERPDTNKFTGADSLRHHLLNNAACVKAVLEDLNVEELPESAAFLAPFCDGPERWEDYDQLTDLKSVKEAKMKLRNFVVIPFALISSSPPTLTPRFSWIA